MKMLKSLFKKIFSKHKNKDELLEKELIDKHLHSDFDDKYVTEQQRNRDEKITNLLGKYVDSYESKVRFQRVFRIILCFVSLGIIVVFAYNMIDVLKSVQNLRDNVTSNTVVSIITASVTFLVSIISILQIIAKYCFPQDDEQYITEIVKTIQENDFKHKQENIKLDSQNINLNNFSKKEPKEFVLKLESSPLESEE